MDYVIFCLIVLFNLLVLNNAELLHSASGKVGGGNFTYYSMMYEGFVSLELITLQGDCDLYVSQHVTKPTYEPESYCLQSATCGLDTVVIPKSFKRPVGIGIFGHPSHEHSYYQLNVYQISGISENEDFTDELFLASAADTVENGQQPRTVSQPKDDHEQESFVWVVFWSVIEFLIEVMFL